MEIMSERRYQLQWRNLPGTPPRAVIRAEFTVAVLVGGFIYVHSSRLNKVSPFYVYSLRGSSWRTFAAYTKIYTHSAFLVDDKIIVLGGNHRRSLISLEALDLAVEARHLVYSGWSFGKYPACTAYVESRREVMVLLNSGSMALLLGVHVDTGKASPFNHKHQPRIMKFRGGSRFFYSSNQALIEWRDVLFVAVTPYSAGIGNELYELTFGYGRTVAWSQVELRHRNGIYYSIRMTLQKVNGLVVAFGGADDEERIKYDSVVLLDPLTKEVVRAEPNSLGPVRYEGQWPSKNHAMGSVVADGKMLIFGGMKKVVELAVSIPLD